MKVIVLILVLILSGAFMARRFLTKPPPPPPPVEAPPPPPPFISPEEEAKIIKASRDVDPSVRWQAVGLIDSMKSPKSEAVIFERLHEDDDLKLRMNVVQLLETKRGPEVAKNLVLVVQELANPVELRIASLHALSKVGELSVAGAVTGCLQDPNEGIRVQALKTLDELNTLRSKQIEETESARRVQEEMLRQEEDK